MAIRESDMGAEMNREITTPGESPLPPLAINWSGRNIEAGTGRVSGEASNRIQELANQVAAKKSQSTSGGNSMAGSLEELVAQVGELLQSNGTKMAGMEQQRSALQTGQANAAESLIPQQVALKQQVSKAAMAAQDAGIAARNSLENNPDDPNSLMALLAQDFVANTKVAREQRQTVAAKKQVGLFDNPLEFLWNQVTLPDDINALKATQAKADMAQKSIAEMQSMTTASAQAAKATEKTLTNELIAQQAQVDTVMLQQKVADIRSAALGTDIEGLKILSQSNAQVVDNAIKQQSLQNEKQRMIYSAHADSRAELESAEHMRRIKEDEAGQDRFAAVASIAAKTRNRAELTADEIKYRVKYGSPRQKAELDELYEAGLYQEAQIKLLGNVRDPAIATTPGKAAVSLAITGGMDNPQYKPVMDFMQTQLVNARAQIALTNPQLLTKDSPAARQAIANQVDRQLYGAVDPKTQKLKPETGTMWQLAKNVETEGNILRIPDLPELARIPAVAGTTLGPVIQAAAAAGVKDSKIDTLIAQGKAAGLSNEQLAQGISDVVKAGRAAVHTGSGASKFGLPYYSTYIVPMPTVYGVWGKDEIDWADTAKGLSYLNFKEVAAQLRNRDSSGNKGTTATDTNLRVGGGRN